MPSLIVLKRYVIFSFEKHLLNHREGGQGSAVEWKSKGRKQGRDYMNLKQSIVRFLKLSSSNTPQFHTAALAQKQLCKRSCCLGPGVFQGRQISTTHLPPDTQRSWRLTTTVFLDACTEFLWGKLCTIYWGGQSQGQLSIAVGDASKGKHSDCKKY